MDLIMRWSDRWSKNAFLTAAHPSFDRVLSPVFFSTILVRTLESTVLRIQTRGSVVDYLQILF